jgi:hypothetical protein
MPKLTGPLTANGAVVEVLIGLCQPDVQRLRNALQPIPPPVSMPAILDTGAAVTCVDSRAFAALGLSPTGVIRVVTAATSAPLDRDQFDVGLTIAHPSGNPLDNLVLASFTVTDSPLVPTGIPALVGCDVLARCRFVYDGPAGMFSLEY